MGQSGVESDCWAGSEARTLQTGHHHPHTVDQALLGLTPVLPAVLQPGVDDAESVVGVPLAGSHHPPGGIGAVGVRPPPGGVPQYSLLGGELSCQVRQ